MGMIMGIIMAIEGLLILALLYALGITSQQSKYFESERDRLRKIILERNK